MVNIIIVSDDHSDTSEKDDHLKKAKDGGKEILESLRVAKNIFTKRFVEGIASVTDEIDEEKDSLEQAKDAGSKLGRSILQGISEGISASMKGIISGGAKISDAIQESAQSAEKKKNKEYVADYEIVDDE